MSQASKLLIEQEFDKITDAEWAEYERREAAAIVYDPSYVPDWPGFVAFATQAEADEATDDLIDYLDDVDWLRHGC